MGRGEFICTIYVISYHFCEVEAGLEASPRHLRVDHSAPLAAAKVESDKRRKNF